MKHTIVKPLFISMIMQKLKSLSESRNGLSFLLIMGLLSFNTSFLPAQSWGTGAGTKHDRLTINNDYTNHWSYLRLQTGGQTDDNGQAWNMINQGDLWWGFTDKNSLDATGERLMTLTKNGNLGIGVAEPERKLEVDGDALINGSIESFGGIKSSGDISFNGNMSLNGNIIMDNGEGTDLKQIFTWNNDNWRIGTTNNPGFTRSMTTSYVQFLTYTSEVNQGFAVGVHEGESSFEIQGSDHAAFFRGNVGIGTTSPNKPLTLKGSGENNELIGFQNSSGDNKYHWNLKDDGLNLVETGIANARLFIKDGGNIGIGTSAPSEKLEVAGNIKSTGDIMADRIRADRVILNIGTFPDYVFADDYELMSLEALEDYIQAHKHLPKMPTESEVVEKGADLGEINRLLVEKVEELTLHLIEVNKEFKALKETIKDTEIPKDE